VSKEKHPHLLIRCVGVGQELRMQAGIWAPITFHHCFVLVPMNTATSKLYTSAARPPWLQLLLAYAVPNTSAGDASAVVPQERLNNLRKL
jgi:hypothetical protein